MNTLKLKVLLILTNGHLWASAFRSVLIWFCTGILGCAIVQLIFLPGPPSFQDYFLSLAHSSPAILLAIPVLYFLQRFKSTPARVAFALCSILATCCIIIGSMVWWTHELRLVVVVLSPFIPSAIFCFFLIAGKQTLDPL